VCQFVACEMRSPDSTVRQLTSDVSHRLQAFSSDVMLRHQFDEQNGSPTRRGSVASSFGHPGHAQQKQKISWRAVGATWRQEPVSPSSTPPLVNGDHQLLSGELPAFSPHASIDHMPHNFGNSNSPSDSTECMSPHLGNVFSPSAINNNGNRAASVGMTRAGLTSRSKLDSPSVKEKESLQWLEERIETESSERRRLWSSLMEDLGKSQATVKRLEEKLENMQHMLQGQTGCSQKLEGNPQEVNERCEALEERMDRLNKHYGMLEMQLGTLQMSIEQTKKTPAQLETRLLGFAAQLEEEQLANERRNQQLDCAISKLQAKVAVKDTVRETCSAFEARWKADVEQLRRSEESLVEQFEELHARSEMRCSTLEARVGGVCVPELVASTADRLHKRINTLQQALIERRSSGDIREPSPLIIGRGRRNSC